jgi:metal iron transporter
MIVAIVMGRQGISTLLVASQVVLSMTLPFVILPLIYLTSSKKVMSVRKIRREPMTNVSLQGETTLEGEPSAVGRTSDSNQELGNAGDEWADFSSSKITTLVGVFIWLLIVAANVYVLVSL